MTEQELQNLMNEVDFGNPNLATELLQRKLNGTEFADVLQNRSSLFWVIFSTVFSTLYQYQQKAVRAFLPQLFASSATGHWLEQHALDFDLHRRPAQKAKYELTLHKQKADDLLRVNTGDMFLIGLGDPRKYSSLDAVQDSQTVAVKIEVEAEEVGKDHNVIANRISLPQTNLRLRARNSITHSAIPLVYGAEQETDTQLKNRLINSIAARIKTGTNEYYKNLILSVAGVGNAQISRVEPANSQIQYAITGISGAASPGLVGSVQNLLDTEKQPTDLVQVVAAQPQALPLNLQIKGEYIAKQVLKSVESFFQDLPPATKFESSELSSLLYSHFSSIQSIRITPQHQVAGTNFFVPTITFGGF